MQDPATSKSSQGRSRRHLRLGQLVAVLAILAVAFGLFAWQQGGDDGGPLNAIAEAAEKTQDQPGGRVAMRSVITIGGQPPFTMTGRFVFDAEDRTEGFIVAPRTARGGAMRLEAIADGTTMYMRSSRFGSLPDGAEWMALDLSLGDDLNAPAPANVDAKGELALLEEVSDDVQKLGKEDVRGVPTTRYRGTIPVSDQVEQMREEGADNLASVTEKDGLPFHVEVWIDVEGLVRRMRLVHTQPAQEGKKPQTIDMRMDFFDFGFEPEIDVPDSSEVFDATALAKKDLGIDD